MGHVGDRIMNTELHLHADAALAGNFPNRTTSGMHLAKQSQPHAFPLSTEKANTGIV